MKTKGEKHARKLIKEGAPISAIRHIRSVNVGMSLFDAKELVMKWRDELGISTHEEHLAEPTPKTVLIGYDVALAPMPRGEPQWIAARSMLPADEDTDHFGEVYWCGGIEVRRVTPTEMRKWDWKAKYNLNGHWRRTGVICPKPPSTPN